jgi:hypothetical protein
MRWFLLIICLSLQAQVTNLVANETPTPDGSTQFFKLQHVPIVSSVKVYINGVRQVVGTSYAVYPGGASPRIGFFPCCIPQVGVSLIFNYHYLVTGPQIISVQLCSGITGTNTVTNPSTGVTTTYTSDCTGLYYVDFITPAGTEIKLLGSIYTNPLPDPGFWSIVP